MVSENFNYIVNGNFNKYAGQWIAVSGNKVVANAGSASEVIDEAKKKTKDKSTIMKVPEKDQVLLL